MSYSKSLVPVLIVALLIFSNCSIGGKLENVHVANNPSGDQIKVTLSDEESSVISGELLSIHEQSVFLLNLNREIMEIYYPSVKSIIIGNSRNFIRNSIGPNSEKINEFRLHGRYPQGIDEELQAILLSAYNQESVFVIK